MSPRHWTLTVEEAVWACRWIGPVEIDGDARPNHQNGDQDA